MAVSRKEGIQHEIELSAAWGPTIVSAIGLPASVSAHQMPTDLSAVELQLPTGFLSVTYRPLSGRHDAICQILV